MQRYNIVHYYNQPIETVVRLLKESDPPIYNLVDLPNVSENELLESREAGDKKYIRVKWCVHGQIPKICQKLVRPEMLTFIEDSVWNRTTRTYSTKIIPRFFKNQIDCRHRVEFHDNGDGRTKRVLAGHFEVKIPIIGAVFELAVMGHLKQNAESDFQISNTALTKYIAQHGDPSAEKAEK